MKIKFIVFISILVLIGLGLWLGLWLGLFKTSNNSTNNQQHTNIVSNINIQNKKPEIWNEELCNQYMDICNKNIKNNLVPESALSGCISIANAHGCII